MPEQAKITISSWGGGGLGDKTELHNRYNGCDLVVHYAIYILVNIFQALALGHF